MAKVKISELPALTPATLDTTFVVGISGSTTYKISINQLTSSLDTTFATDLVTAALSSSLDGKLSTASYSTDSASFNSRIISGSAVAGTISSSAQITTFGFISTSTDLSLLNTISASYLSFTQSYYSASSSFDSRIDGLENATSSYLTSLNGAISSSTQISDLGFVTGSYTTINSFNSLTQSFNSISQSFNVISGSVGTIDFSTLATTASNTFIGNQTISGSTSISGGLTITNNGYSWSFESNGRTKIPNITFNSDRGTGMVGIKPVAGREFQIETSTAESSAGPWVFGLDGTLSAPNGANILRVGNLVTTESFNSFTQSYYSASSSFDTRIDSLENATSSYLTSLSGAISSSSQLTSSYDTRYTLSGSVQPLPSNLISSSAQITAFGFISSSQTINTGSFATTGSNTFTGNNTFSGSVTIGSGGGNEGGELQLAYAPTNSTLTGSAVAFDVYQNRVRIFENGGNNRGGYFDLTTLGNGVSTNLVPTLYLLEAYANDTYTLPGSFTEDPCRYSVVNNTVNVSSGWFNTSTYTFTPQKAGYWEITAAYDVYRLNNVESAMAIKKNNGIVVTTGAFGAVAQQVTKIVYLNGSTDFINVVNVGGAANSRPQYEGRSWFQARWVGE
jgi:hypothetical protein